METGVFSTGCTAVVSTASGVEDVAVLSGVYTTGRTAVTIVCACPGDMYHRHRHVHIILYFPYIILSCIRYIVSPWFYNAFFIFISFLHGCCGGLLYRHGCRYDWRTGRGSTVDRAFRSGCRTGRWGGGGCVFCPGCLLPCDCVGISGCCWLHCLLRGCGLLQISQYLAALFRVGFEFFPVFFERFAVVLVECAVVEHVFQVALILQAALHHR